jgi:FkbM family methyltransferase
MTADTRPAVPAHDLGAVAPIAFDVAGARFDFLDPDGAVAAETAPGQIYEPATTALLSRLLADGAPTFLDVGAHYGYFTCLAGRLNPRATVLAFEPGARHHPVLEANIALNGLSAEALAMGLSDTEGRVPFRDRTQNVDATAADETVAMTTGDALLAARGLRADVVKVDVHGAEGLVLGGLTRTLAEDVTAVLVEIHAAHLLAGGYDHARIIGLLEAAGLTLHECESFRDRAEPTLVPLVGDARAALVEPERWTAHQVATERLVLATRGPAPL